ncbi:MAG: hypothetical protein J6K96_10040 [Treponema sp.]|nr:hypothetical protein [Treponema sp.]
MKFFEFLDLLNSDKEAWRIELGREKINFFFLFLTLREFKIVFHFRLCQFLRTKKVLFPIYCMERFLYRYISLKNGCDIPSRTRIGGGFVIHHCTGVVINGKTEIGKNLVIRGG